MDEPTQHAPNTPEEDEYYHEPRKITFFIELPEPIPIPHGSTYSKFLDITIPGLAGVPIQIVDTKPHTVDNESGNLFVSIRFWQVVVKQESPLSDAVHNVMRAVLPTGDSSISLKSDESTEIEVVKTVIDAVTTLLPDEGENAVSNAFDRCLATLEEFMRGYLIAISSSAQPITYELTPMIVPYVTARYGESLPTDISMSLLILRNLNLPMLATPDWIQEEGAERALTFFHRLLKGDPTMTFADATLRAQRALERVGDYGSAIIHVYIACEVLLDAVLSLMLWEEGMTPEVAAETVFSERTAKRAKTHFKDRLGGSWETGGTGPVAAWARELGDIRHRVVHLGYSPTRSEANRAMAILDELNAFVRLRLAHKRYLYPRAALLLLGIPGLEKRNAWSKRMQRWLDEHAGEPEWVVSYSAWRRDLDRVRDRV